MGTNTSHEAYALLLEMQGKESQKAAVFLALQKIRLLLSKSGSSKQEVLVGAVALQEFDQPPVQLLKAFFVTRVKAVSPAHLQEGSIQNFFAKCCMLCKWRLG